nr:ATP-binding cassette domain-containing protein [Streptomyces hygroscopicus]
MSDERPLLEVRNVSHRYGDRFGCRGVDFDLWPGEVLAVVGESGSGKSTLLGTLSQRLDTSEGSIRYRLDYGDVANLAELSESAVRRLWRSEWGFVHQNAADGLRMQVSAGGNVGEPLMANGWRHYGRIRAEATDWLERVEIPRDRVDDTLPRSPVVCGSGCRSPGTSSSRRALCSWTSRPAAWTFPCRHACSTSSVRSSAIWNWPSSSSRTTSPSPA